MHPRIQSKKSLMMRHKTAQRQRYQEKTACPTLPFVWSRDKGGVWRTCIEAHKNCVPVYGRKAYPGPSDCKSKVYQWATFILTTATIEFHPTAIKNKPISHSGAIKKDCSSNVSCRVNSTVLFRVVSCCSGLCYVDRRCCSESYHFNLAVSFRTMPGQIIRRVWDCKDELVQDHVLRVI